MSIVSIFFGFSSFITSNLIPSDIAIEEINFSVAICYSLLLNRALMIHKFKTKKKNRFKLNFFLGKYWYLQRALESNCLKCLLNICYLLMVDFKRKRNNYHKLIYGLCTKTNQMEILLRLKYKNKIFICVLKYTSVFLFCWHPYVIPLVMFVWLNNHNLLLYVMKYISFKILLSVETQGCTLCYPQSIAF